jgi:hypothetical protein
VDEDSVRSAVRYLIQGLFSPAIQLSPMVPSKASFPSPASIENKDNSVFEDFFWR